MFIDIQTPLRINQNISRNGSGVFYPGDIIIEGNVRGNLRVNAGGNLLVTGDVELASLYAGKNIIVKGSVTGSSKTTFVAGGNIRLASAYNLNAQAGGDIEVFSNIEISQLYAGGQITMLTGTARDSRLFALQGLWLTAVTCSALRASSLTAGFQFNFFNQFNTFQQAKKRLMHEQQGALNALAPVLKKLLIDSSLRKKIGHEVETKMTAIEENEYEIQRINRNLLRLEKSATADAVPVIVCEKYLEKGCLISLQQYSRPLADKLTGPFSLIINQEKQAISKVEGAQGLQKIRKETA